MFVDPPKVVLSRLYKVDCIQRPLSPLLIKEGNQILKSIANDCLRDGRLVLFRLSLVLLDYLYALILLPNYIRWAYHSLVSRLSQQRMSFVSLLNYWISYFNVPNHTDIPKGDKTPNFVLDIPTGVLLYASRGFFGDFTPQPLVCQQLPLKKTPDCKKQTCLGQIQWEIHPKWLIIIRLGRCKNRYYRHKINHLIVFYALNAPH